jgi:uncharacterized protein involved in tolerance to divalent cations
MEHTADVSITAESAYRLADFTRSIVNDRLAACGNIVPRVRSSYRWEGAIPSYRDWVLASALDAAEYEQTDPSQHQ